MPGKKRVVRRKSRTVKQLKAEAKAKGCTNYSRLRKAELEKYLLTCGPRQVTAKPSKTRQLVLKRKVELAKDRRAEAVAWLLLADTHKKKPVRKQVSPAKTRTVKQLKAEARAKGCTNYSRLRKAELEQYLLTCGPPKVTVKTSKSSKTRQSVLKRKAELAKDRRAEAVAWLLLSDAPKTPVHKLSRTKTRTLAQLKAEARAKGCTNYSRLRKAELEKYLVTCGPRKPVRGAPKSKNPTRRTRKRKTVGPPGYARMSAGDYYRRHGDEGVGDVCDIRSDGELKCLLLRKNGVPYWAKASKTGRGQEACVPWIDRCRD